MGCYEPMRFKRFVIDTLIIINIAIINRKCRGPNFTYKTIGIGVVLDYENLMTSEQECLVEDFQLKFLSASLIFTSPLVLSIW